MHSTAKQESLPSYEEVEGVRNTDTKLPTSRNHVFDVPLDVPAAHHGAPPEALLLINDAEAALRADLERVIRFEINVEQVDTTILELLDRLIRVHPSG